MSLLNCRICGNTYKIDCLNISAAEARKIHTKSGLTWTCKTCTKLGDDINGLKTVIVQLQNDIKALQTTFCNQGTVNSPAPLMEIEKIVQEITECEKRKSSIIIYGSKEKNVRSNKDQLDLDMTTVPQILAAVDCMIAPENIIRLGKFDPTNEERQRPIKVILPRATDVNPFLRSAAKLKASANFTNISISPDRTPMQIQFYRDVRANLDDRLAKGEQNLKIK